MAVRRWPARQERGQRRPGETVSPGKGSVGTFSPPLDAAGNSVRGQRITRYLAEALGLNLFASAPVGRMSGPLAPC